MTQEETDLRTRRQVRSPSSADRDQEPMRSYSALAPTASMRHKEAIAHGRAERS
jgi:hypothetical protein